MSYLVILCLASATEYRYAALNTHGMLLLEVRQIITDPDVVVIPECGDACCTQHSGSNFPTYQYC